MNDALVKNILLKSSEIVEEVLHYMISKQQLGIEIIERSNQTWRICALRPSYAKWRRLFMTLKRPVVLVISVWVWNYVNFGAFPLSANCCLYLVKKSILFVYVENILIMSLNFKARYFFDIELRKVEKLWKIWRDISRKVKDKGEY